VPLGTCQGSTVFGHGAGTTVDGRTPAHVKVTGWKTPGLLRAVTGGVVPLPLGGPLCLTRCRCLLCLLAGQAALTPSANPSGKSGLHHAHRPLFRGEPWRVRLAASLLRLRIRACDARQRQRTGTVQVSSVRPRSEADIIVNAAQHINSLRSNDACFRTLVPVLALNGHGRHADLRITSVFPCVARGFKAWFSFRFTGCYWWRPSAVDASSGTSRGHSWRASHA
jgi:hypothetical protein